MATTRFTSKPDFKQTDIFGALELASQLFNQDPGAARKELVIFSDLREGVPGLDFEHSDLIPALGTIANRCGSAPDLHGVDVYAAGVDDAGNSMTYWQSLQTFWLGYFKNADATLQVFTVLREVSFVSQR